MCVGVGIEDSASILADGKLSDLPLGAVTCTM